MYPDLFGVAWKLANFFRAAPHRVVQDCRTGGYLKSRSRRGELVDDLLADHRAEPQAGDRHGGHHQGDQHLQRLLHPFPLHAVAGPPDYHARQYSIASPRNGERPGYNNLSLTIKRVKAVWVVTTVLLGDVVALFAIDARSGYNKRTKLLLPLLFLLHSERLL